MTEAEWREAFRRCCIIADWPSSLSRPTACGEDGVDWCSEAPGFDVEANARAMLDDEKIRDYNDCADEWLMEKLLGVKR